MSKSITSPIFEIRLENHGKSTGVAFATLAGDMLPMNGHRRVIVPWELIVAAHRNGSVTVTISADDIAEHDRRIFAERTRREERERDAALLAEAKARALADAEDLLDNLDLQDLSSQ